MHDASIIFPAITINPEQFKTILLDNSKQRHVENNSCQIAANNDLEAISCWLQEYTGKTYSDYQREGRRLLLWCLHIQKKSLARLKVADFKDYFAFLQNPPLAWRMAKGQNRRSITHPDWRPFNGALTKTSLVMAIRIINSLINYLVEAQYLPSNPIKLIKQYTSLTPDFAAQKYQVWQRMLEIDEWQAVQAVLQTMPDTTAKEQEHKLRAQFLFALFYFLGLRINEVARHSWNAFRVHQEQWWFFVQGKGGKLGHVPVNKQLLTFIKVYRLHLGKAALPTIDETDNLLVAKTTKEPLSNKMLYRIVKHIGEQAAAKFTDPYKQAKLRSMSPHWLRHLSASHQDKAGSPATVIQQNHRHGSINTTQLYIHAEDARRFSEIQKLSMQIIPSILERKSVELKYALEIKLTKGPLNKLAGVQNLAVAIEKFILAGLLWEKLADNLDNLMINNGVIIGNRPIEISYSLQGIIDKEQIIQAVSWEAKIRLFEGVCVIRDVE